MIYLFLNFFKIDFQFMMIIFAKIGKGKRQKAKGKRFFLTDY